MDKREIKEILNKEVDVLLNEDLLNKKSKELKAEHMNNIHCMPLNYKVMSGLLQSLNIRHGLLIENFTAALLNEQKNIKIHELTGKKIKTYVSENDEKLITNLLKGKNKNINKENFRKIINKELDYSYKVPENQNKVIDIDLFFSIDNQYYLFEIKSANNHDTGKDENIIRKLLRTYISLKYETKIDNIIPGIFYFNTVKKTYNGKFLEENVNCFIEKNFWTFFCPDINFKYIEESFEEICKDKLTIKKFDKTIRKVLNN